ncbi:AAA family ATPase [Bradyrhizobium sp. PMVTL-01]|uniref:AAA family ATPase n=1 Tax=Bradyrhizobium sp. PMVTL-01 TaxID=3434999 RepID=UPI003F71447D
MQGFIPPDYLLDGILQRRFCYSFTAKTGTGKTAIMLRLAAHVALGRPLGNRDVERGKVLYFAGENPDDIRMRWIIMAVEMGFDPSAIDVYFIAGTFKISEMMGRIREEMVWHGDFAMIVVDTSAAYFEGEDENSNAQAAAHARRLRALCTMPGGPCVVVACHPPKNVGDDNLQPRGGGAFLAEVDGNLIARKDDSAVEMHWQGKYRGPDFAPLMFRLLTVAHHHLKDSKGRLIPTVLAEPLSEEGRQEMAATGRSQEDQLLQAIAEKPAASLTELATLLGWKTRDGMPNKSMAQRKVGALIRAQLITKGRDGFALTPAGQKGLDKIPPK